MSNQLLLIHQRQAARYGATCCAVRSFLRSLAATRIDGVVDSDDCAEWLDAHGHTGDKRLIGAILKPPHFVQCGFTRSRRRRGMHAQWRIA